MTSGKPQRAKDHSSANQKHGEGEKDRPEKFHITNESLRIEADLSPGVIKKYDAANEETTAREKKKHRIEKFALLGLFIYCSLTFWQGWLTRSSIRYSERAWVGFVPPARFPLEGTSIPATIQVTSFGKTPARRVTGHVIATVLKKSEEPIFDYSIGHVHNNFYTGVIFPNDPVPITLKVVRYTPMPPWRELSSSEVSNELTAGQSYIVFYGEIEYFDIFDKKHWTHFCTGTGKAMESDLNVTKKCIEYNDVDHD